MKNGSIRIKRVDVRSLKKILPLIANYQRFYGEKPDARRNRSFFSRLVRQGDRCVQFVALDANDAAVGFATLYSQPSSLTARTACVMNDLYVVPTHRGSGVGQRLVERSRAFALSRRARHLEWMTKTSNTTAQRLYARLSAARTEWYYYCLPTQRRVGLRGKVP